MTIRAYNFAKPPRLIGDWHQRLTGWFQAALSVAAKAWLRELPFALEARAPELDAFRFGDWTSQLKDGTVGYRIVLAGNRLPTLLVMPRPLLLTLVDGLLGAGGTLQEDRDLTPVEWSLADYFLQSLWVPFFKDAWPGTVPVVWDWPQLEAHPQCSRLLPADTAVTVFTWIMRGPFGEQPCAWAFPRKGLAEALGAAESESATAAPAETRVESLVRTLPLDLVVHLGSVEIALSQLAALQVGDVILLNQRVSEPLTALVGEEPKFVGRAGRAGSSTAYRVEAVLEG